MKRLLLFITILSLGFGLAACGEEGDNDGRRQDDQTELIELTLEELAEYDGREGRDAYIAVDGKIYDVTDDPNWPNGNHNGYQAGFDWSDEIGSTSPHGTAVLSGVPQIGVVVENNDEEPVTGGTVYLTITDLEMYDGQDGNSAYIAYEGMIYDVTDVAAWSGGNHNGVSAGQDITAEIMNAPHGTSPVEGLTAIGELVIDTTGDAPYDPYLYLTTEDLAMYDGTNDNPMYIAYMGLVYDVTNSDAWSSGSHGGADAGTDITAVLANAPHGTSVVDGLTVVGEYWGTSDEVVDDTLYLTIEELAMYDGSGGNPAYIAYEGMIYDVSAVSAWSGGSHNGVSAGQDITAEIMNAPHGTSPVAGLTAVGELVIDSSGTGPFDPYLYLTTTELAMYDGSGSNAAYIAYNGVVYDVTGVSAWSSGSHGGVSAGTDVTSVINSAPHGTSVLEGLVIVGEIITN
jgi:predicted heme/steroid binding protein